MPSLSLSTRVGRPNLPTFPLHIGKSRSYSLEDGLEIAAAASYCEYFMSYRPFLRPLFRPGIYARGGIVHRRPPKRPPKRPPMGHQRVANVAWPPRWPPKGLLQRQSPCLDLYLIFGFTIAVVAQASCVPIARGARSRKRINSVSRSAYSPIPAS